MHGKWREGDENDRYATAIWQLCVADRDTAMARLAQSAGRRATVQARHARNRSKTRNLIEQQKRQDSDIGRMNHWIHGQELFKAFDYACLSNPIGIAVFWALLQFRNHPYSFDHTPPEGGQSPNIPHHKEKKTDHGEAVRAFLNVRAGPRVPGPMTRITLINPQPFH